MMKHFKSISIRTVLIILLILILASCIVDNTLTIHLTPVNTETLEELAATIIKTPTSKEEVTQIPDSPTPTASPTPTRPNHLEIDPEKLKGIELRLLHPWQDEKATSFQALVTDFNENNLWGITIVLDAKRGSEDLFDAIQTDIHGDSIPEILVIHPYQAEQLNGNHYWVDLTDYIFDSDWGLQKSDLDNLLPYVINSHKVGEKILGLPALSSGEVLFYNVTWAKELGFNTPPLTIEELRDQSCAAYQSLLVDSIKENDGTGGLLLNSNSASPLAWNHAFGGQQLLGSGELIFSQTEGNEAFIFVKSLFDEGCAWIGRLPKPFDYFSDRYTLIYAGSSADILTQRESLYNKESTDEWIILPYPTSDRNGSLLVNNLSYMISINKPEVQLASWLFLRWALLDGNASDFVLKSSAFPVTKAEEVLLSSDPQWFHLIQTAPVIYHIPIRSKWTVEDMILRDAFDRMLALEAENIPTIMQTLDETLSEIYQMGY